MSKDIDMVNRDPNSMNGHVQVMFDDVLGEPEGAHSMDCVWKNAHSCLDCGLSCCYKLVTFFCGLPIALMWGCGFAMISFYEVWLMTPGIRAFQIILSNLRKLMSIYLGAFVAPFYEVGGLLLSRIHVTTSTGEPPKPFGTMDAQQPQQGKPANVKNFK